MDDTEEIEDIKAGFNPWACFADMILGMTLIVLVFSIVGFAAFALNRAVEMPPKEEIAIKPEGLARIASPILSQLEGYDPSKHKLVPLDQGVLKKGQIAVDEDLYPTLARNGQTRVHRAILPHGRFLDDDKEQAVSLEAEILPLGKKAVPLEAEILPPDMKAVPLNAEMIPAGMKTVPLNAEMIPAGMKAVPLKAEMIPADMKIVPLKAQIVEPGHVSIPLGILEGFKKQQLPLTFDLQDNGRRFALGESELIKDFAGDLTKIFNTELLTAIKENQFDVLEVFGHTDGAGVSQEDLVTKQSKKSNFDLLMKTYRLDSADAASIVALSNADLGLLRALAVARHLVPLLRGAGLGNIKIRAYSAGNLVDPVSHSIAASSGPEESRRRIEIRLSQSTPSQPAK